jgi:hypothetical protein
MQLHVIETGLFKLDGGAMYGVVPKTIWNRQNPADENNLCNWAMRCLLIESGDRLILIDTGIGTSKAKSSLDSITSAKPVRWKQPCARKAMGWTK